MNDTVPKEDKIEFINWFMSKDVANAAGTWILRKVIQRNGGLIKRTHFTKATESSSCLMIVASADYEGIDEEDFVCTIGCEEVTYRTMHSYLLNNKDKELYIHFKYNGYKECKKLMKLIGHSTVSLNDVLCDIFLDTLIAKRRLAQLDEEIDRSLLTHDPHEFHRAASEREELLKNNSLL